MKKRPSSFGFTLIELLVVIAIIGILASMLLPVLAKAKAKAKDVIAVQNMKQVAMAFEMYIGDNDETFPKVYGGTGGRNRPMWLNYRYPADSQILQYLGSKDVKELEKLFVHPKDLYYKKRDYKYSFSMNARLSDRSTSFASPQNMAVILEEACQHDPNDRVNATNASGRLGYRHSWNAKGIDPNTGQYNGKTVREVPINDPYMLATWNSRLGVCDPDVVTFRHNDEFLGLQAALKAGELDDEKKREICNKPSAHVIFADFHIGLASRTEAKNPGYMEPDMNTADLPHMGMEKVR